MSHEGLSATTRNILALASSTPVILVSKDPSSRRADRVIEELLSIRDDQVLVCQSDEGVFVMSREGVHRFLV